MTPLSTVIFDFDYTLADPTKGEVECINCGLASIGLNSVSNNEVSAVIGLSLKQAFTKLAGEESLNKFNKFRLEFINKAHMVMADRTLIYPGAFESLDLLKKHNISTGIVSTKHRSIIREVLDREYLSKYIDIVIGGDDVRFPKPNPQGLMKAVKFLKSSASKTIYVGDTVIDAKTAARANISFVAVLTGPTTLLQFKRYKVYRFINNLYEIASVIC